MFIYPSKPHNRKKVDGIWYLRKIAQSFFLNKFLNLFFGKIRNVYEMFKIFGFYKCFIKIGREFWK